MKGSAVLRAFLQQRSSQVLYADCYTFKVASLAQQVLGQRLLPTIPVLTATSADRSVVDMEGVVYAAGGAQISGLAYKGSIGLDTDEQTIVIADNPASPTWLALSTAHATAATVGAMPLMAALVAGLLDGATVSRKRVFYDPSNGGFGGAPVGEIVAFFGLLSTVEKAGRVSAEVKVRSFSALLDVQMPRNLYQPQCNNTFGDPATCGYAATPTTLTVAAGATTTVLPLAQGITAGLFDGGALAVVSGGAAPLTRTVKSSTATTLTLARALPVAPAAGDAIEVYPGCDRTMASCQNKFNNLARFRGYPFIPQEVTAYA